MKPEENFFYAFYKAKRVRMYFNEIKEYSELGDGSLANIIKQLKDKNLITIEKTKGNTFYSLINNIYIKNYFSEFDMNKFNELNNNVKIPLSNLILNESFTWVHFIVLFGSASRKKEGRDFQHHRVG